MGAIPITTEAIMEYHQAAVSKAIEKAATQLLSHLRNGNKVLWLLSGGSGGDVCVQISKQLAEHDLSNLFVTMSDERYGVVGHKDENMQQLLNDGLTLPGATIYRPLYGASLEDTVTTYAEWLTATSAHVDYRFAILGVGSDGHTSGIKPHSVAVSSPDAAVGYKSNDFTRITTTVGFLTTLDEAVVQAYGADKHTVINQLLHSNSQIDDAPMMVIRQIPKVTVFSDTKERVV